MEHSHISSNEAKSVKEDGKEASLSQKCMHQMNKHAIDHVLKSNVGLLNTQTSLEAELSNMNCELGTCAPMKRIILIMTKYNLCIESKNYELTYLLEIMTKQYSLAQIIDDFQHLNLIHVQQMQQKDLVCDMIRKKSGQHSTEKCRPFNSHIRNLNSKNKHKKSNVSTEHFALHEAIDRIHCFCYHSNAENFKRKRNSISERKRNDNNDDDDDIIFDDVYPLEFDNMDQEEDTTIYWTQLCQKMGFFQWHNYNGTRAGNILNRELSHLKPRFANIKLEVLNNSYYQLSRDCWNQTLRKATAFNASWAKKQCRAMRDGEFIDHISGQVHTWRRLEDITLPEIVTLKLYTDFDKLQLELKRCYRFTGFDISKGESTPVIIGNNDKSYKCDQKMTEQSIYNSRATTQALVIRLRELYHWRIGLSVALHKFGTYVNPRTKKGNMVLFHGVNRQMILDPNASSSFYGPLSCTTCFHVARTFATQKGMVLKIESKFPRLGLCNAFNASLISDYPEEQEWLIGHMYVRILEVIVTSKRRSQMAINDVWQDTPAFFAVNLFMKDIYAMSDTLECYVLKLLNCRLGIEYIDVHMDNMKTKEVIKTNFNQFCEDKTMLKLDTLSDQMRTFFFDVDLTPKFEKWQKVFPNLEEIRFYNHCFNDGFIKKFNTFLKCNKNTKMRKMHFCNYERDDPNMDDITIGIHKEWKIGHGKIIGGSGYQIKLTKYV